VIQVRPVLDLCQHFRSRSNSVDCAGQIDQTARYELIIEKTSNLLFEQRILQLRSGPRKSRAVVNFERAATLKDQKKRPDALPRQFSGSLDGGIVRFSLSIGTAGNNVMKPYSKMVAVLILLVFAAVASESAMAGGGRGGSGHRGSGHGGGYSHGYGHGHGYGVGISFGFPYYWPGYYSGYYAGYPYGYAYPGPAYSYPGPTSSGAYVEQGYAQAAPAPQQDWYYCAGSNAYHPYVKDCPGGWQRVPSVPPPPR
jgi:hypothetical protein